MLTLHDIYSRVANDIQDISHKLVTKGEYFILADEVARYISRYVDIFVRQIDYTATAEVYSFTIPIQLSSSVNNLSGTNIVATMTDDHYKVNRMLKVVRNNQDCREMSWAAIESGGRGNAPFKVNSSVLDYRFFAARLTPTGDIELHWTVPIAIDETVTIFALCDFFARPAYSTTTLAGSLSTAKWSEFKDYTPIPDLISNLFYANLLAEVINTLVIKQGDVWMNRLAVATDQAKKELYEVRKHVARLKDMSSVGQIQPFKWLSEDNEQTLVSNANIPKEWSTIIIL